MASAAHSWPWAPATLARPLLLPLPKPSYIPQLPSTRDHPGPSRPCLSPGAEPPPLLTPAQQKEGGGCPFVCPRASRPLGLTPEWGLGQEGGTRGRKGASAHVREPACGLACQPQCHLTFLVTSNISSPLDVPCPTNSALRGHPVPPIGSLPVTRKAEAAAGTPPNLKPCH